VRGVLPSHSYYHSIAQAAEEQLIAGMGGKKKNSFKKVTTSFSRHSLKYSITDVIDTVSGES
jgi:hypothetical protein